MTNKGKKTKEISNSKINFEVHLIYMYSCTVQTAIPILIGTKFDDFVRLPPDIQWTVITEVQIYINIFHCYV